VKRIANGYRSVLRGNPPQMTGRDVTRCHTPATWRMWTRPPQLAHW